MWCFVCGREYRSDFERCWECEVDLVSGEPSDALLPSPAAVLIAGPDYGDRHYFVEPAVVFAAACEGLSGRGWVLRVRDPERGAIAGSTRKYVGRRSRLEGIAVYLNPGSDGACHVRCAIQYSGSRQNPLAREGRSGEPSSEVADHLLALDALLDLAR